MTDTIEIAAADGEAEALVAGPGDGTAPGVLFFMDAIGLRAQIAGMVDRIAGWGYEVLAPNVFYRSGRAADLAPDGPLDTAERRETFFKSAMGRVRGLTVAKAEPDLAAYVAALRRRCAPGAIGTTGYCMGARLALRAATGHPDDVAAAGGFHGGGLATEEPDSPHAALGRARAEFVFGHADHDSSMPPEAVHRLGVALADAGLVHINDVYAGAPHGYAMADTASYREEAAERHFRALEALLDRTLR